MNISGPTEYSIALSNSTLVIGGVDNTYIFFEKDGSWEEVITLKQPFKRYALAGKNLITTTGNDVLSQNIEACVSASLHD
mgnify:CR=1 FL=1